VTVAGAAVTVALGALRVTVPLRTRFVRAGERAPLGVCIGALTPGAEPRPDWAAAAAGAAASSATAEARARRVRTGVRRLFMLRQSLGAHAGIPMPRPQ